ncbi:MAG TPA: ABC transporter ATP-binding protein [Geobacteraceae bacterium]
MSHQPLLSVQNLAVSRGGAQVLQIPQFQLSRGETVAIIGPNGAGKSSFLLTLARLLTPDSGVIQFKGSEVACGRAATGYRRQIAMVFQEPLLFDATVYANVATGLKLRGLPTAEIHDRVLASLERFRISHLAGRSARTLSGGEAQRTSLARACATEPELILLDEPFVALDPPTRQALTDDLEKTLHDTGIAAIITTHDQVEALRLSDRLVVMHDGTIVQSGTPSMVMNQPVNEFVATFVGMENIFTGTVTTASNGLLEADLSGQTLQVPGDALPGEHVVFCIHPEHVVITTHDPAQHTSARNVFPGRVIKTVPFGFYTKVYLDCGFLLVAAITNQSLAQLALQTGSAVHASFKATAVHLFRKG